MISHLARLVLVLNLLLHAANAAIESAGEQDKPSSADSLLPSLMQASRLNLMMMQQQQQEQASTPPQFDYYDAVREEDNRRRQLLRTGEFLPRAMVLEPEPNFANGRVFRFLQTNNRNPQQQVPEMFVVEGDTYDDASNEKAQSSNPKWPAIVRPVGSAVVESTTEAVHTATRPTVEWSVSGDVDKQTENKQATGRQTEIPAKSAVSEPETSSEPILLKTDSSASTDAVEVADGTASTSPSQGSNDAPAVGANSSLSPISVEPMPEIVEAARGPRFNRS